VEEVERCLHDFMKRMFPDIPLDVNNND